MAAIGLAGLVLGLVALQAADHPGPEELVVQLGGPRYADREAAGEALLKIGRTALPALSRARESRDLELRRRAEILAVRIEATEFFNATRIPLDIRDRPLAEAVDAIARTSGQSLKPGKAAGLPGADPSWPDARVTLVADQPVPFWEAIDQLCAAAGLQRAYPPAGESPFPFKSPFELTLVPGKARPPVSDAGGLRVELLRIQYLRQRNYNAGPSRFPRFGQPVRQSQDSATGTIDRVSYAAEMLVSAEPRLRIIGIGAVERAEVVDDRGRSLLKVPTAKQQEAQRRLWQSNPHLDPSLNPGVRFGSGFRTSTKTWAVALPLSYPTPRARRIVTLRGVIPVAAVARRPDPLMVDLKNAAGKTVAAGATRITVHEFKADGQGPTVDLTLETPPLGEAQTIAVSDVQGRRPAVNQPIDLMELRLEALDARGESLPWNYMRAPSEQARGRMTILIRGRNGTQPAPEGLRLRFWELVGAATDLPFAFHDVPTP